MFCTQCGIELRAGDRYCPQCGRQTGVAPAPGFPPGTARLSLPWEGKKIAGVCAGFARYLGVDVTLVRIAWLTLALLSSIGFVAYLIAWIIMPRDPQFVFVQPQPAQPAG